jgi:hypothetical protein
VSENPKVDDHVWRALRARLSGLDRARVKVGIIGAQASEEHAETGATNAEIGAAHEFGTATIPERSWLRSTFRDQRKREQLRRLQARLLRDIMNGKITVEQAMGLLGAWGMGAVKATITRDGHFAPLKPATIARKGSSKPLIDTGQIVGAITWAVVA